MSIQITCPSCGEEFRVRDEAAGKSFKCKVCGTSIPIPNEELDDFEDDDRPRKKKKKRSRDNRTLGPAIGLYVTGGLALAYAIFSIVSALANGANPPPQLNDAQRAGYYAGFYAAIILLPLLDLLILIGAYCLQNRVAYPMAVTGCVLASIPCCSPCVILGMPFGIWGLVMLFNEDVKRSFN